MHKWLILLVFLVGCGGSQQQIKMEPSKPTKPPWISSLPKKPGFVYVVGVKTRAKTLEEGKEGAHQNATVQVSNVVGTQIQSEAESRMSTEGPDYSKEEVESRTAAFIKSLVQMDEYYEKTTRMVGSYYEESYDVWSLARFPLAAADQERKRQAAEQAEIARDGYKRFIAATDELKNGNQREAWILLHKSKHLLDSVPPLTELHEGSYDTSADLLRAVDKDLRNLDELARGVKLEFDPGDKKAKSVAKAFQSSLSEAVTSTKLILRTEGDARFILTINFTTKLPKKKVMGQKVGYLTFAGNVKDTWSGAALPGTNGEVKGFGKSAKAALTEASKEAATKIASGVSTKLIEVLDEEKKVN